MYSVILLAALAGNSETPAWHLKKAYAVNAYGGYVYQHGVYGGGYGASYNYGPYYETGFGYSYRGTGNGVYYGPYLKNPMYSTPASVIPRSRPADPVEEVLPVPKVEENSQSSSSNRAKLFVEIPANASLFIDGKPFAVSDGFGTFVTPELESDKTYSYLLKIEMDHNGTKVVDTKKVVLKAGDRITKSFIDGDKQSSTAKRK
jgi:uncharacterized protein (TIGR03000 family)